MKKLAILAIALCISSTAIAQTKDVVSVFENAIVEDGVIVEDAVVVFGDLSVRGNVRGSAIVIGGNLNVGSNGGVRGDTVVIFGKINKEPGAELLGKTIEMTFGKLWTGNASNIGKCTLPFLGILTIGIVSFFILVGFLAIFLLIVVLFTDRVGKTSYSIELHPWKAIYHGLIIAVLVVPVTIFLIISIIGIPIVPLLFILLSAATLFGYTAVCQLIGLKFFKAIKKPGKPMVLEVIIGFIILGAIAFIPFVGCLVKCVAWLAGLGSAISTKFGTHR